MSIVPVPRVALLAVGLTTLALVAPACGSSGNTSSKAGAARGGGAGRAGAGGAGKGGSTAASGGKGGSGAGGGAGTGAGGTGRGGTGGNRGGAGGTVGAGDAGGPSALRCGTASCAAVDVEDFTLPACCPRNTENRCGYDVSAAAEMLGVEAGCVAIEQPGSDDPACEDLDAPSGLPGLPATYPGCCSARGVCGVFIDVEDALGIDFGCVEMSGLSNGGSPVRCGDPGAGGAGGDAGAGGTGAGGAAGDGSGGEGGAHLVCGGSSLGLVAHHRGDGNLTDSSGRGHDGVFVAGSGGPLAYAAGSVGEAMDFPGTGHVEIADAADLDPKVGVTLSAWIRSDAGAGTHRDIVGKDGEGYVNGVGTPFERQYFIIVSNLNRLRAHVGTADGLAVLDGTSTIPIGTWVHAAMTYDAETGELRLYRDGVLDGSLVVSGDRCLIDTPQPLRIGGGAPSAYDQLHFTGRIDDVRVYDRALSAEEIVGLRSDGVTIATFGGTRGGVMAGKAGSEFATTRSALEAEFGVTWEEHADLTTLAESDADGILITVAAGEATGVTPLTASEQTALLDFVETGHFAILITENDQSFGAASDSFVAPFGFSAQGTVSGDTVGTATVSHPITSGWSTVDLTWPGSLSGSPAGTEIVATTSLGPFIAVFDTGAVATGSGKVVIITDASPYYDAWSGAGSDASVAIIENALRFASDD